MTQRQPIAPSIPDAGIRELFTEESRFQSWLDGEAALAQAQAELGIIPEEAAKEITLKAQLSLLDIDAIHRGLARTGHSLVPLIWELDRVCEGGAGGYAHWGATTQNIVQTGKLMVLRRAHGIYLAQLGRLLLVLADLAEDTDRHAVRLDKCELSRPRARLIVPPSDQRNRVDLGNRSLAAQAFDLAVRVA